MPRKPVWSMTISAKTTDEDEIKRAETVLQEFEEKIKALLQKRPYLLEKRIFFLSKYRIELNDDTPAAQKIDSMIEDFRKKKELLIISFAKYLKYTDMRHFFRNGFPITVI